jgi:hypothetical protein
MKCEQQRESGVAFYFGISAETRGNFLDAFLRFLALIRGTELLWWEPLFTSPVGGG